MKKFITIFFFILLIALIIIQFFRPAENKSNVISVNDMTKSFTVPDNVQTILKVSCNDCHSSNTDYPWYFKVQPVAWWLDDHIRNGKEELNFSEFGSYDPKKQYKKFEEIIEDIETDDMPLPSFLFIHRHAILNEEQKSLLISWSDGELDQMKSKYPYENFEEEKDKSEE